MLDIMKNLILAGVGAAVLTRDKASQFLEQAVDQGQMSAEEAEKMAEEMVAESKKQAQAWGEKAAEAAQNAINAAGLAKRDDLEALEQRIAKLELELDALKRSAGQQPQK